jgi:hypothetical protein
MPGEDALLAREASRHLLAFVLAHLDHAVHARALEDLRQVGLGPLADARHLRAVLRLHPITWIAGFFSLRKREHPMMVPVVPMVATKCVTFPSVSRQISGPVPV